MSFQELSDMRVTFGETKLNQKFIDVIEGDPKYTQWFAKKFKDSPKESHQAFLYFLQLYVEERKELESSPSTRQPMSKGLALKAKAKSQPMTKVTHETTSQGSWSDEDGPWDVMHEEPSLAVREELADTRRRMDSMENMMAQITQHLRLLTQGMPMSASEQ